LQDNWTAEPGARELKLDLWSEDYYHASILSVRCAHYRPHEGQAPALAAVVPRVIDITDRFRRDFPFVRWHRSVSWLEPGGTVPKSKLRASAVHKTDIRQRCKFCDTGGMTRAYNSAIKRNTSPRYPPSRRTPSAWSSAPSASRPPERPEPSKYPEPKAAAKVLRSADGS